MPLSQGERGASEASGVCAGKGGAASVVPSGVCHAERSRSISRGDSSATLRFARNDSSASLGMTVRCRSE